jgi:excisionase family DNA binding protein
MNTLTQEHPISAPQTTNTTAVQRAIRRTEAPIDHLDPVTAERIRRDPPKLLNIAEAATYLGVSARTIRDRIADRRLTCIRLGGRVLLRTTDLERDLERLTIHAR